MDATESIALQAIAEATRLSLLNGELLTALRSCFVNGDPAERFAPNNALTEQMIRAAIAKATEE